MTLDDPAGGGLQLLNVGGAFRQWAAKTGRLPHPLKSAGEGGAGQNRGGGHGDAGRLGVMLLMRPGKPCFGKGPLQAIGALRELIADDSRGPSRLPHCLRGLGITLGQKHVHVVGRGPERFRLNRLQVAMFRRSQALDLVGKILKLSGVEAASPMMICAP